MLVIFLIFIFFLMISTCRRDIESLPGELPDVGLTETETNSRIQLTVPEGLGNSYKNRDALNIIVNVVSNDQIIFGTDFGARIFTYENEAWKEIENRAIYTNPSKILLSTARDDPFKLGLAGIAPYVDGLSEEIPIRIFLIGNIYQNGKETDRKTGAYIDVVLSPSGYE